jgi:hypothetical protein
VSGGQVVAAAGPAAASVLRWPPWCPRPSAVTVLSSNIRPKNSSRTGLGRSVAVASRPPQQRPVPDRRRMDHRVGGRRRMQLALQREDVGLVDQQPPGALAGPRRRSRRRPPPERPIHRGSFVVGRGQEHVTLAGEEPEPIRLRHPGPCGDRPGRSPLNPPQTDSSTAIRTTRPAVPGRSSASAPTSPHRASQPGGQPAYFQAAPGPRVNVGRGGRRRRCSRPQRRT